MDPYDSDDDILPSFDHFKALFSKPSRPAQPSPISKPSKSNTKQKKGVTSTPKPTVKKGTNNSTAKSKVASPSKEKNVIEISADTKDFLAELDEIGAGNSTGIASTLIDPDILPIEPVLDNTTLAKGETRSTRGTKTEAAAAPTTRGRKVTTRATGRGRGGRGRSASNRSKRTKIYEETLESSDNEDGIKVLAEDNTASSIYSDVPEEVLHLIQILWNGEPHHFRVPQETKMSEIRMQLAKKVGARADNLLILNGDDEVMDTLPVEAIQFGITLEAFEKESNKGAKVTAKTLQPGFVLINLQGSGGYRQRCSIAIKKTTHMKQLVDDYVEKFDFHGKNFKLMLDGEIVDLTETPDSLDLENNDMIDIVEVP